MTTTLVTGGAGFVGANLCERLIADGDTVIALDNLVTGRKHNLAEVESHPAFSFIEFDLNQGLPELPKLDRIYHCASPASPPEYQRYPIETLLVNAEGTRRLLDLAIDHGARFLFTSTSEVYGDPLDHPQREDYRGHVSSTGPRSMYDESKRYAEALITAYAAQHGVETRIVRIFNTYGRHMAPHDGRVVSNFIVQALKGEDITLYGDGAQTRSFCYVDDLVDAFVAYMDKDGDLPGPYNLGNPDEFTIRQLAETVIDLTGSTSKLVYRPLPSDDPRQRQPDIEKARETLGWRPKVQLRDGLKKTIAYFDGLLKEGDPLIVGR